MYVTDMDRRLLTNIACLQAVSEMGNNFARLGVLSSEANMGLEMVVDSGEKTASEPPAAMSAKVRVTGMHPTSSLTCHAKWGRQRTVRMHLHTHNACSHSVRYSDSSTLSCENLHDQETCPQ